IWSAVASRSAPPRASGPLPSARAARKACCSAAESGGSGPSPPTRRRISASIGFCGMILVIPTRTDTQPFLHRGIFAQRAPQHALGQLPHAVDILNGPCHAARDLARRQGRIVGHVELHVEADL